LLTDIYSSLKSLRYDKNAVSKSLAPLQAASDKPTELSKTTITKLSAIQSTRNKL